MGNWIKNNLCSVRRNKCSLFSRFAFSLSIVFLDELWIKLSPHLLVTVPRTSVFSSAKYHAIVHYFILCILEYACNSNSFFFSRPEITRWKLRIMSVVNKEFYLKRLITSRFFSLFLKYNVVIMFSDVSFICLFNPVTVRMK